MEQQDQNLERQIGLNDVIGDYEFAEFLSTLDAICQGDYENENSKEYKKAKIAFSMFLRKKWTVKEFRWVMLYFAENHKTQYWFPADFLHYHDLNYGTPGMNF